MAEVLVLAEHAGETVKKVTLELLTLARRFGEPAVVWLGDGAEGGRERLAEFGAAKVYVADGEGVDDYVAAPAAEVLASLVGRMSPAAVLVAATAEGKEIAGRLAVKTSSGMLTDAVGLTPADDGPGRWPSSPSSAGRSSSSRGCGAARRSWRCGRTPPPRSPPRARPRWSRPGSS